MIVKKHETIEDGQIVNKKVRKVIVMYDDDTCEEMKLRPFLARFKPSAADQKKVAKAEKDQNLKIGDKFYLIPSDKHRGFFADYYNPEMTLAKAMLTHGIATRMQVENMLHNYQLPHRSDIVKKGTKK
jgi:hypothetical protein